MGAVPPKVDSAGFVEIPIVFTPVGAGVDEAIVEIKTDKPEELPLKLLLEARRGLSLSVRVAPMRAQFARR